MAVFYLLFSLFIPALMLGLGILFWKRPPEEISYIMGYRTAMSMKNKQTWHFAQVYFGRLWARAGGPMLAVSGVVYILFWVTGASTDTLSALLLVLVGGQTILLVLSILPVEHALRRNFDDNGNPR